MEAFKPKKEREVLINSLSLAERLRFPPNFVNTTKYSPVSFIPKTLWEQFRRVANVYFLVISVLQLSTNLSPTNQFSTVVPLIGVLAVSMIKEGIEDIARHAADAKVNNMTARTLNPRTATWELRKWMQLVPGDIILLKDKEQSPLDMVVLSTAADEGKCYVETASLDGEANLKLRTAVGVTNPCGMLEAHLARIRGSLRCDLPNSRINEFTGSLILDADAPEVPRPEARVVPDDRESGVQAPARLALHSAVHDQQRAESPDSDGMMTPELRMNTVLAARSRAAVGGGVEDDAGAIGAAKDAARADLTAVPSPSRGPMQGHGAAQRHVVTIGGKRTVSSHGPDLDGRLRVPVGPDNIILRGTSLQNTAWAVGFAVYAGPDTKLMRNANITPSKRSRMDRMVNRAIGLIFAGLFVMVAVATAFSTLWQRQARTEGDVWYLPFLESLQSQGSLTALTSAITFLILFNNLVPISLYVTLEIVKWCQARAMEADTAMNDPVTGRPAMARTSNLNEDLGQIEYIFSDKTGTLTKNMMKVTAVSIAGVSFGYVDGRSKPASTQTNTSETDALQSFETPIEGAHETSIDALPPRPDDAPDTSAPLACDVIQERHLPQNLTDRLAKDVPFLLSDAVDLACRKERSSMPTSPPAIVARHTVHEAMDGVIFADDRLYQIVVLAKLAHRAREIDAANAEHPRPKVMPAVSRRQVPIPGADAARAVTLAEQEWGHKKEFAFAATALEFLYALAVCHSVIPERVDSSSEMSSHGASTTAEGGAAGVSPRAMSETGNGEGPAAGKVPRVGPKDLVYQSSSPDEIALVLAARAMGFSFQRRSGEKLVLNVFGIEEVWTIIAENAFDSSRKRMSVLAQRPDKSFVMYAKGADNVMLPLMEERQPKKSSMRRHMGSPKPGRSQSDHPVLHADHSTSPDHAQPSRGIHSAVAAGIGGDTVSAHASRRGLMSLGSGIPENATAALVLPSARSVGFGPGAVDAPVETHRSALRHHTESGAEESDSEHSVAGAGAGRGDDDPHRARRAPTVTDRITNWNTYQRGRVIAKLEKDMHNFAVSGLRTLLVGFRDISSSEANAWKMRFGAAANALGESRVTSLRAVAEEIEHSMIPLGVTAIEDQLQDGVPETIEGLRSAGCKIWMLTGDKEETAVNIAQTCQLISSKTTLVVLNGKSRDMCMLQLANARAELRSRSMWHPQHADEDLAVIVNGEALSHILPATPAERRMEHEARRSRRKRDVALMSTPESVQPSSCGSSLPNSWSWICCRPKVSKHKEERRPSVTGSEVPDDTQSVPASDLPSIAGAQPARAPRGSDTDDDDVRCSEIVAFTNAGCICFCCALLWAKPATGQPTPLRMTGLRDTLAASAAAATTKPAPTCWPTAECLCCRSLRRGEELLKDVDHDSTMWLLTHPVLWIPQSVRVALGFASVALESIPTPSERRFLELIKQCKAVVACRVSPMQKAQIVRIIKTMVKPHPMTLAIGDGGNDVSMIQEADVGVGISGQEGMQAVRAADFAISQFRFLRQLLLVHGRWNYNRIAATILYSFYKNIALVFTLFIFTFFNGISGTTLYESYLGAGWNVGWTFLPILTVGIVDRDISAENSSAYPMTYHPGQHNERFNARQLLIWVLHAVRHAATALFGAMYFFMVWNPAATGKDTGLWLDGSFVNLAMVLIVNTKLVMEMYSWSVPTWSVIALSLLLWFGFVGAYSQLFAATLSSTFIDYAAMAQTMLAMPMFWIGLPVIVAIALVPDFLIQAISRSNAYSPSQIVQEWDRGMGRPHSAKVFAGVINEFVEARLERLRDRQRAERGVLVPATGEHDEVKDVESLQLSPWAEYDQLIETRRRNPNGMKIKFRRTSVLGIPTGGRQTSTRTPAHGAHDARVSSAAAAAVTSAASLATLTEVKPSVRIADSAKAETPSAALPWGEAAKFEVEEMRRIAKRQVRLVIGQLGELGTDDSVTNEPHRVLLSQAEHARQLEQLQELATSIRQRHQSVMRELRRMQRDRLRAGGQRKLSSVGLAQVMPVSSGSAPRPADHTVVPAGPVRQGTVGRGGLAAPSTGGKPAVGRSAMRRGSSTREPADSYVWKEPSLMSKFSLTFDRTLVTGEGRMWMGSQADIEAPSNLLATASAGATSLAPRPSASSTASTTGRVITRAGSRSNRRRLALAPVWMAGENTTLTNRAEAALGEMLIPPKLSKSSKEIPLEDEGLLQALEDENAPRLTRFTRRWADDPDVERAYTRLFFIDKAMPIMRICILLASFFGIGYSIYEYNTTDSRVSFAIRLALSIGGVIVVALSKWDPCFNSYDRVMTVTLMVVGIVKTTLITSAGVYGQALYVTAVFLILRLNLTSAILLGVVDIFFYMMWIGSGRVADSQADVLVSYTPYAIFIFGFSYVGARSLAGVMRGDFLQQVRLALERRSYSEILTSSIPRHIRAKLSDLDVTGFSDTYYDKEEQISVIFVDIQDFERITNTHTPQMMVSLLDRLWRLFDALAEKHMVTKMETVGKTYMACAGLHNSRSDHAAALVMLGLDMIETLKDFVNDSGEQIIHVKIGIHTGPAVSGIVGKKKQQFSLFGDTVNTASRMQSSGEVDEVHVSTETHAHLDGLFECTPKRTPVKSKGILDTFAVHRPLLHVSWPPRDQGAAYSLRPTAAVHASPDKADGLIALSSPASADPTAMPARAGAARGSMEPAEVSVARALQGSHHEGKLSPDESVRKIMEQAAAGASESSVATPSRPVVSVPGAAITSPARGAGVSMTDLSTVSERSGVVRLRAAQQNAIFESDNREAEEREMRRRVETKREAQEVRIRMNLCYLFKDSRLERIFENSRRIKMNDSIQLSLLFMALFLVFRLTWELDSTALLPRILRTAGILVAVIVLMLFSLSSVRHAQAMVRHMIAAVAMLLIGVLSVLAHSDPSLVTLDIIFFCAVTATSGMMHAALSILLNIIVSVLAIVMISSRLLHYEIVSPDRAVSADIFFIAMGVLAAWLSATSRAYYMRRRFGRDQLLKQEASHSNAILYNMLPAKIITQMREGRLGVSSTFYDVTILFCDIVGFTKMAGSVQPSDVVDMLHKLFCEFDKKTDELHIFKVQTIGDAYVMVAGMPFSDRKIDGGDDEERAAKSKGWVTMPDVGSEEDGEDESGADVFIDGEMLERQEEAIARQAAEAVAANAGSDDPEKRLPRSPPESDSSPPSSSAESAVLAASRRAGPREAATQQANHSPASAPTPFRKTRVSERGIGGTAASGAGGADASDWADRAEWTTPRRLDASSTLPVGGPSNGVTAGPSKMELDDLSTPRDPPDSARSTRPDGGYGRPWVATAVTPIGAAAAAAAAAHADAPAETPREAFKPVVFSQLKRTKTARTMVEMAMHMLEFIKTVPHPADPSKCIEMRIGLHTGTIVGGVIGSKTLRYDIWGNDVLIANKMESEGIPGGLLVSEDTYSALVGNFSDLEFKPCEPVKVRGREAGIKTYQVKMRKDGILVGDVERVGDGHGGELQAQAAQKAQLGGGH